VDTVGENLSWSLGVVRVSRSFSALPVTQAHIKSILILFIIYVWFSLNHIQDPFGVLDEIFRIYTLVTPIKSQQYQPRVRGPHPKKMTTQNIYKLEPTLYPLRPEAKRESTSDILGS
jgi:hypothetical protein